MFRAFQRKLATHATLSAAVVCLVVLGAAALIWWSAAGLPDAAVQPSAAPAPVAPVSSPPSASATPSPIAPTSPPPTGLAVSPPARAERGERAEADRREALRPLGQSRPAPSRLSVRTILVGADRALALVDGRIVRVGDRIGSAVVLAIGPRVVEVREADGSRRTLELARPAPGAELR